GISGVLVFLSVRLLDRLRLDDPVGAISVHLTCGVWGTLAVGIFGADMAFLPQAVGVLATGAFCFTAAFGLFFLLKVTVGIRVDADEEIEGLDIGEHGMEAYSGLVGFARTTTSTSDEPVSAPGAPEKHTLVIAKG